MAERNSRSSRPRKRSGTVRSAAGAAEGTGIEATAAGGEMASGPIGGAESGATDSALGADLEAGAEPIVIAERITVIAEAPLGDEAGDATLGPGDAQQASDGAAITAERRWLMIAERAYQRARERGFEPGRELEDWLVAEQEIDSQLAGRG